MRPQNSILVTLKGTPLKFHFEPDELQVDDNARVVWQRTKDSVDFTFAALAFYGKNPFKDVIVHVKENEITAIDDYEVAAAPFKYSVLVKVTTGDRTTYYNSFDPLHRGNSTGPTNRNK
jgi:hypothetical protein